MKYTINRFLQLNHSLINMGTTHFILITTIYCCPVCIYMIVLALEIQRIEQLRIYIAKFVFQIDQQTIHNMLPASCSDIAIAKVSLRVCERVCTSVSEWVSDRVSGWESALNIQSVTKYTPLCCWEGLSELEMPWGRQLVSGSLSWLLHVSLNTCDSPLTVFMKSFPA